MGPLVSVIMPIYNCENYILKNIKNILDQNYKNIELLLIDDGSTDNTLIVLESLIDDKRVKIISIENSGSGIARNKGIEVSTGDLLYFPDADDIVDENCLKKCVECYIKEGSDLIIFSYEEVLNHNIINFRKYENKTFDSSYIKCNYHQFHEVNIDFGIPGQLWNKVFSSKIVKGNHIIFSSVRRHQDKLFFLRYLDKSKKITFMNDTLYKYKVNDLVLNFKKFPINYIDIINEVFIEEYAIVKEWNNTNERILSLIKNDYVNKLIDAIEFSCCDKFDFSFSNHINWINNIEYQAHNYFIEYTTKSRFRRLICKLLIKKYFICVLILVKTRNKIKLILVN